MVRIIVLLIFIAVIALVVVNLAKLIPNKKVCPRCEGKGYWYGLRNREKCEQCGGTGYLD